jgi:AcrR family transcriptional regulator
MATMDYNYTKIDPIYKYYLNTGFDHSMQKIADIVQITKKTLFNRYRSKENLEYCLVNYWQANSCERIAQRMEYANNAVEKLMMFLFELQYCRKNEWCFFQKMKEIFLEKFEQINPLFITQLEKIFTLGVKEELFKFDSEPKVFAYFFQFNALFVLLSDTLINTDYISFLLSPILTEAGKKVFQDIDIEQIFRLN